MELKTVKIVSVFPAWAGMNRVEIKEAAGKTGCSPRGRG